MIESIHSNKQHLVKTCIFSFKGVDKVLLSTYQHICFSYIHCTMASLPVSTVSSKLTSFVLVQPKTKASFHAMVFSSNSGLNPNIHVCAVKYWFIENQLIFESIYFHKDRNFRTDVFNMLIAVFNFQ